MKKLQSKLSKIKLKKSLSEIIVSVSGVRGIVGDSLTPQNIIRYTSAFSEYCKKNSPGKNKITVGRDGRLFGDVVENIVTNTLTLCGFRVVNIGIAPTPTVQIATEELKCAGGISITASHNPQIWNGLKFLNPDGTFLDELQVNELIQYSSGDKFGFARISQLKSVLTDFNWIDRHIKKVLDLKIVNVKDIRKRKFKIVVDAVNSSGSVIVPKLLEKLGCNVIKLFCDSSGIFPHTPEPVPQNLTLLSKAVKKHKADIGIAVDPDADRLVLITDKGEPFGEENTITTAAKFVLKKTRSKNKSATVNLSTTRSVEDIAVEYGSRVFRSPVGEINVVKEMLRKKSAIGGEGSGGVIFPALHYGRDSLAGIILVLNEIAEYGGSISGYKKTLPEYFISKTKVENVFKPDAILEKIKLKFSDDPNVTGINFSDGLKIDFVDGWVHIRKSNTEPIMRIIAEAKTRKESEKLMMDFSGLISL